MLTPGAVNILPRRPCKLTRVSGSAGPRAESALILLASAPYLPAFSPAGDIQLLFLPSPPKLSYPDKPTPHSLKISTSFCFLENFTPHTSTPKSTPQQPASMPRQRSSGGGRSAPSRPTVPSRAPAAPTSQHQTRPATSYAAPTTQKPQQAPPAAQAGSQGPGLFGQMASTAAYVLSTSHPLPLPRASPPLCNIHAPRDISNSLAGMDWWLGRTDGWIDRQNTGEEETKTGGGRYS